MIFLLFQFQYCDFFRPKYFILENVRNFASFNNSVILMTCMRTLASIGYQCSFGILQAGHYGVAQTRRRCILLAAAPGYKLPKYPEPTHAFAHKGSGSLRVKIDNTEYTNGLEYIETAPLRTITVRGECCFEKKKEWLMAWVIFLWLCHYWYFSPLRLQYNLWPSR